jgi:uroporphyrinogen III methyltransferase/synthase
MKRKNHTGRVILVGGGPGDPGLLTLAGAEALAKAEAVVYDWLVSPSLLQFAPEAEAIFVGKRGGAHYKEQSEINGILLRLARAGKRVVRLKGGDPFMFGRGGEEASFLAKHKIEFEVVPGVSAGTAVPAYAGIPLTDRRFASQVTWVTGHEDPAKKTNVGAARRGGPSLPTQGTLVFFMGVRNLPQILKEVQRSGWSSKIPVAVIEWGTLPRQRVVTGTVGDIYKKALKAKIEPPALTVIGEVVRVRQKLAWFEKKPLLGKSVIVTRARAQASALVRRLSREGAEVYEFPAIEILPPRRPEAIDAEIRRISNYHWIVFTSANGVDFFFKRVEQLGKDARIFLGVKIAAIGEATAQALRAKGLQADLVPSEFTSEALFRSLEEKGELSRKKFLLARADIAPPDLRKALEKEGGVVVEIEAYRTRKDPAGKRELLELLRRRKVDYVTFTSSSTVRNFFEAIPPALRKGLKARFVSIGPVTSKTLEEYGFKPVREAKVHTIEGLAEVLINGGGES